MLTKSKLLFVSLLFLLASLSGYGISRAQFLGPQNGIMFSGNCAQSLQYGTALLCWDTLKQWMYYQGATQFSTTGAHTQIGNLPVCNSSQLGLQQIVNNSTAISAEGQTCAAGSNVKALAICLDGGTWKCF